MKSYLLGLLLLASCGSETHTLAPLETVQKPGKQSPAVKPSLPAANVIDSVAVPVTFNVDINGGVSLSEGFSLVTVPSSTNLTVYTYLNSSAGSSLGVEEFGYFNVNVKNNSNAIWNKTDIYLGVRFAAAGNVFQSADGTLVTSIIKPTIGAEAESVTAIPTGAAGTGVRAYSLCNATVGACAAKPSFNATYNGIKISGNFNVPAGSYAGTVTFELLSTP